MQGRRCSLAGEGLGFRMSKGIARVSGKGGAHAFQARA